MSVLQTSTSVIQMLHALILMGVICVTAKMAFPAMDHFALASYILVRPRIV